MSPGRQGIGLRPYFSTLRTSRSDVHSHARVCRHNRRRTLRLQDHRDVYAKHNHAFYYDFNISTPSRPTRQDGEAGMAEVKAMLSTARVPTRTRLCQRQHISSSSCMENAKRRLKTTIKQLNRRCLAVPSAGVINRELSEAPGTRRSIIALSFGRASRPYGAHFRD